MSNSVIHKPNQGYYTSASISNMSSLEQRRYVKTIGNTSAQLQNEDSCICKYFSVTVLQVNSSCSVVSPSKNSSFSFLYNLEESQDLVKLYHLVGLMGWFIPFGLWTLLCLLAKTSKSAGSLNVEVCLKKIMDPNPDPDRHSNLMGCYLAEEPLLFCFWGFFNHFWFSLDFVRNKTIQF